MSKFPLWLLCLLLLAFQVWLGINVTPQPANPVDDPASIEIPVFEPILPR